MLEDVYPTWPGPRGLRFIPLESGGTMDLVIAGYPRRCSPWSRLFSLERSGAAIETFSAWSFQLGFQTVGGIIDCAMIDTKGRGNVLFYLFLTVLGAH